ncbi:MAG TPA: dihydrolipoyl dehydrogenase [Actinomycetota bacterium]|nr:dihydrolipoyl dehydrogenase [Actinomycetota bacterium]
MADDAYDLVVLGSGTGGYAAALRAAVLGRRVALIEKDERLGGTCLLRGCIPSKALLESAAVMDRINRSEEWGIDASGTVDWPKVLESERHIVDKKVQGLTGLIKARKIDVIQGTGKVVSGPAVEVDGRTIQGTDVVLATGSYPRLLPGMELSDRVITSDQALVREALPSSVVIIGAGAIGMEFATVYRSFGVEVTVLEALPRILPLEDEDISKEAARAFKKRGIDATPGVKVSAVKEAGDHVEVTYAAEGADETTISAEMCLVAVGRGPISEGLGYEEVGIELDRGYVKVDGQLQTSVPHVWAVGDVAATPLQLAHSSFLEGMAVAERTAGLDVPEIDYAGVPRVTFSQPEVSSVGLTEAQAKERGHDVETKKFKFDILAKANIVGEGGLVKVVSTKGDGPVLGVHMVGPHVTELIAEATLVYNWEAVASEVASLIHPHPTLSEAMGEVFLSLAGKPLNTM